MPNLPGSSVEKDWEMFENVLTSSDLQVLFTPPSLPHIPHPLPPSRYFSLFLNGSFFHLSRFPNRLRSFAV